MKRIFVYLLIALSCKQPRETAYNYKTSTDSVISYMQLNVRCFLQNRETDSAARILDSLYPFVHTMDHYAVTCNWLNFKASLKVVEGELDSARLYIDTAMQIALKKDTTRKILLTVQIQFANVLKELKAYDSALLHAREAYELARKIDTTQLPIICYRLYEIYGIIGDIPAMRKYLFEGYRISKQPLFKTLFSNGITDYYERVSEVDSAIAFFKTVEKDTSLRSSYYSSVKYTNIGLLLARQNRLKEALHYQLKGMLINKDDQQFDGWAFENLAQTYLKLKQYENAHFYFDSAIKIAMKDKDLTLVTEALKKKAETFAQQEKYHKAYSQLNSAFKHYKIEVDSSIAVQAKELETKYAVKEKDEAFKTLAFKNEINERIASQQRLIISALSLVMVLLFIIGILLWRRRVIKLKLHEAELQQQLLRSQMNPHFIFNVLSVLQSFIRQHDWNKSLQCLTKFSKLLRTNLEHTGENFVSLKDEIESLENYLALQCMNFDGKFEYHISLDNIEDPEELLISPMLMQPFVENAILHGVTKMDYKGIITIQIKRMNQIIHCTIEDNGKGLQEKIPADTLKLPLGTKITQDRLSILSKQMRKPAKLVVTDKKSVNDGNGVRVELIIPFKM